jgi:hypothetical protein
MPTATIANHADYVALGNNAADAAAALALFTTGYIPDVATRHYAERSDGTPSGEFTNHADHTIQRRAYEMRIARNTFAGITRTLGLQHWHWAQRAVEQHARRNNLEMPRAHARMASRRVTTPTGNRRFGIEIEFHRGGQNANEMRRNIVDLAVRGGYDARLESYNHDVNTWWKMTTDATVTGGELVSPIMSESSEAIDEALQMVRYVKEAGGTTGATVGMHVHHNVQDHDAADMVRLITNIRHTARIFEMFVPSHRINGSQSYGARTISDRSWNALIDAATNGSLVPRTERTRAARNDGCPVGRYSSFNFNSVLTYGTVEFRLLGHTLNTAKIKAWIMVGQALVRFGKTGNRFDSTMSANEMITALVERADLPAATGRRFLAEINRRHPNAVAANVAA